ncbi:hypothetical protein RJ640_029503 [Escallonia rubra]|uniref:TORTIFOLIA1/SINE1-2 N-terminal domain-containing protein n=1 Tax=Escallonia rubra TaxID=112253 RepID=A0AA88S1H2_9ASTE|nr:hypothetical protein RJ640_029503 [Escallonia rubra]
MSTPPKSDLKHRVITCLNKLSDRDTLAVASAELESIAKGLAHDTFSPFLACLSATTSAEKSPVRKQCVRMLGVLSTFHGDALSPHLSKMLAGVLRRLRDPDSAVRSACTAAVSSMAAHITHSPFFSSFTKPLFDTMLHEQDSNSQLGSALCLSAAIDAAPDPEPDQLQKLMPKLVKLVRSDSFKAKPAVLAVIGSIASAGGASSKNVLNLLMPCLVECLSFEDWAARKAAAEALAKLALTERDFLSQFKSSGLTSLESRRFDKVKVVRETMNRALELWKEVPEEVLPQSQSKPSKVSLEVVNSFSPTMSSYLLNFTIIVTSANVCLLSSFWSLMHPDIGSGGYSPTVAKGPPDIGFETPQPKKTIPTSRSSPSSISSGATTRKRNSPKSSHKKPNSPMFSKMDVRKPSDWKDGIAVLQTPCSEVACDDNFRSLNFTNVDSTCTESCSTSKPETKRVLFSKICNEKSSKFGGLRFGSRVVPFHEMDKCELDAAGDNAIEDVYRNNREVEDLSLIQKQLLQIENQQSSLLDLLQRYMGSSQSGINSLATRVNGLEKALDDISYELAVSTGRISNTDPAGNSCCMLPGAEFLSPKFWRRAEGQYSTSRFSFSRSNQPPTSMQSMSDKEAMLELKNPKVQQQDVFGYVGNQQGVLRWDLRGNLEPFSNRSTKQVFQDSEMAQVRSAARLDGGSFAHSTRQHA